MRPTVASRVAPALTALLAACTGAAPEDRIEVEVFRPDYRGIETALLEGDLVRFRVAMEGARDAQDLRDYADCAAAQYTLIRGYGFVRHVRTTLEGRGGIRRADAVYTVSPDLPSGRQTIDAISRVRVCRERGIPTV